MSDVYSLGVILYELLTGRRPLDVSRRLKHEIERIVCEEQPRNPSDVVTDHFPANQDDGTQSKTDPKTTATLRQSDPDVLRRQLRGDIDKIVLMALKKEPERRYESVEQFANDVQRSFDSQPVIARPDSAAYRIQKFVARNKLGVTAASIVAVVMLTSFVGIATALNERTNALRDKNTALTEKTAALVREQGERSRADQNATIANSERNKAIELGKDKERLALSQRDARQKAERALQESKHQLAMNYVQRGVALLDTGKPSTGMNWGLVGGNSMSTRSLSAW